MAGTVFLAACGIDFSRAMVQVWTIGVFFYGLERTYAIFQQPAAVVFSRGGHRLRRYGGFLAFSRWCVFVGTPILAGSDIRNHLRLFGHGRSQVLATCAHERERQRPSAKQMKHGYGR